MRRARAVASRPGAGQGDAVRRIDDAVGVDAIQLRERLPQGRSTPVVRKTAAHGDGGVRRRSAMLRRMKVTMLLADAAGVADGDLDILGGGWNITGDAHGTITPVPSSRCGSLSRGSRGRPSP